METISFDFTNTHNFVAKRHFLQNDMVDSDAIYGYNRGRELQY